MVQGAGGSMALTDDHLELPEPLQGHYLPSAMIGDPPPISALFTGLPKRGQRGGQLRFRLGSSPRHCSAPACKKGQLYHLSLHLLSSKVFRSAFFFASSLTLPWCD